MKYSFKRWQEFRCLYVPVSVGGPVCGRSNNINKSGDPVCGGTAVVINGKVWSNQPVSWRDTAFPKRITILVAPAASSRHVQSSNGNSMVWL